MERFVLTDAQWAKMEPHCLGKPTDPGRSGSDNRRFVEAVLWIARTGSPWRDLPGFRSEEHTSELQSLMRISYAVFCLKKKKKTTTATKQHNTRRHTQGKTYITNNQ